MVRQSNVATSSCLRVIPRAPRSALPLLSPLADDAWPDTADTDVAELRASGSPSSPVLDLLSFDSPSSPAPRPLRSRPPPSRHLRRPACLLLPFTDTAAAPPIPDLPNTKGSGAAVDSVLRWQRLSRRLLLLLPTLGAQPSIFGTFAGDEHQIGTRPLLFCSCCVKTTTQTLAICCYDFFGLGVSRLTR